MQIGGLRKTALNDTSLDEFIGNRRGSIERLARQPNDHSTGQKR
jgi:hypothetical protein